MIYIDPPFATADDFKGKDGGKAYTDKKAGAEFVEYLRKRLIVAREVMAENGLIYVHLDWKKAHYIKIVMDEVFGENNFLNDIIWFYKRWNIATKMFARNMILFCVIRRVVEMIIHLITYMCQNLKNQVEMERLGKVILTKLQGRESRFC